MDEEQFRILELFSAGLDIELTIHQISKLLGKSYASTNKYTHDLLNRGVLKKKEIGPSILCSLDFFNKEAMAVLCYNSLIKISKFEKGAARVFDELESLISKGNISRTDIVLRHAKRLYAVTSRDARRNNNDIVFITKQDLYDLIKKTGLKGLDVIQSPHAFWIAVAEVKSG